MADSAQTTETQARAQDVVAMLSRGMTRDQVAEALGYSGGYRSLHVFMSRRGFEWDKAKKNYFQAVKPKAGVVVGDSRAFDKPGRVIDLFDQGVDGKEIARTLKFADLRELSGFMASRGYSWSQVAGNYVREGGQQEETIPPEPVIPAQTALLPESWPAGDTEIASRFLPLLEFLDSHRGELLRLVENAGEVSQTLPRYSVPGRCVTKSVHMSATLDNLVRDFSCERNISQREMFEVAMVEFFRKYGFGKEVDALLK